MNLDTLADPVRAGGQRLPPAEPPRAASAKAGLRFDPWLFAQVERERANARERRRQQTLARVEDQVRQAMQRWPKARVYLFGSVVRPGVFSSGSDIDIAVEGLPPSDYFALLGELEDRLQTERLDLIELERCSFAELVREVGRRLQ